MSFWGGDGAEKKAKEGFEVKRTGGEVDTVVGKLIAYAHDNNADVRKQLTMAIEEIGAKQPELALTAIVTFVSKSGSKIQHGHRVQLINIMNTILDTGGRDAICKEVAEDVILFAAQQMVASQEVVKDLQAPASQVLVKLAVPHCDTVCDRLLELFKPGSVPHFYVIMTLADVAAANGVRFTMRLKDVLSRTIPVLGGVKRSPQKWVFSTALGRFAEAVNYFKANASAEEKGQCDATRFESEMNSAFEVILTKWMLEKESKVRMAVAEALGLMSSVISRSDFEKAFMRLVPTYLAMFKKEKFGDHLPVSHGFASILETAVAVAESSCIDPHLPTVMQGLHPLLCRPVNYNNPTSLKNHTELLRSFEVLGRARLDDVLSFVINRFTLPATKHGSLLVLRHFVNSLDDVLEDKKPLIMSSVNTLLDEQDLKLRKALMQLIMSMAHKDYLALEGGQALVRFIAKQCSTKVKDSDKPENPAAKTGNEKTTPRQIRAAGNHILTVMSTKIPSMEKVLWPHLLELLCEKAFSPAIVVIAKCITHLANVKRERDDLDYMINFDALVNIPSPQMILSRLMTLVCVPNREPQLGITIVDMMSAMGPVIHPSIGMYWDESCVSLKAHLEANQDQASFNESKWQDSMLRMFKESLGVVEKSSWLRDLCKDMSKQFKLYKGDHTLNRVIHRYLGALLAKLEAKALIEETIDLMLATVDNSDDTERQGCAQGLGLAGNMHLDLVLPKITKKLQAATVKKKSGFFGFGSSKPTAEDDQIKCTTMMCYGYVAAYANPELILSRLDVHVMHNLLPVMASATTSLLKISVVKAVDLIGKALHVSRLPDSKKGFKLGDRDKIMGGILKYITLGKDSRKGNAELRLLGLNAISTLLNLNPPISNELREQLIATVLPFLALSTPPAVDKKKASSKKKGKYEEGDEEKMQEEEDSEVQAVDEIMMNNLNAVFSSIIHMDPTVPTLVDVLGRLEKPLRSSKGSERERTVGSFLVILKKFVSKCVKEKAAQKENSLPKLGHLLAQLVPRCMDSIAKVRTSATENIQAILYINQLLQNPDNPKPKQEVKLVTEIRGRIGGGDAESRVTVVRDLTAIIDTLVGTEELVLLIKSLFSALTDVDEDASVGSAVVIEALFLRQGGEMGKALKELVQGVVQSIKAIDREATEARTLAAFRAFTNSHFEGVMETLLKCPAPLPEEVVKIFLSLVSLEDPDLGKQTIKHLYGVINNTALVADGPTPLVVTATAALKHIVKVGELKDQLAASYAPVLCTILMRIGTANGKEKSSKDAIAALKNFLTTMGEDTMLSMLNEVDAWGRLATNVYDDGITEVARAFCQDRPDGAKRSMLQFLGHFYSQQSYQGQRVTATSILAEFVNHSGTDAQLLKQLVKAALPRVADKVTKVRKQALRALGNLVSVWSDNISASASAVLSSLTSASEDEDSEVAAEAVASLTKVVTVVDEATMGPMLINVCFRMRPAFDRKNNKVRAAGFALFGELCRFGESEDAGLAHNFVDQVHTALPTLVVHLFDPNDKVRGECHKAFKRVAALLGNEIQAVIEGASINDEHSFEELMDKLAPLLVQQHGDRLRSYTDATAGYYQSGWMPLRGNAASFMANMLATTPEEVRRTVNMNALVVGLIKLLKEKNDNVRQRVARALSLLHCV